MHGPNAIRHPPDADASALRAHQHQAPRQHHQPRTILSPGAPTGPALVRRHRSRPPRAPPAGQSRSPGGQPAPGTPGCTSDACPTYRQPSRRARSPTNQVSTNRGQSDERPGWLGVDQNMPRRKVVLMCSPRLRCCTTTGALAGTSHPTVICTDSPIWCSRRDRKRGRTCSSVHPPRREQTQNRTGETAPVRFCVRSPVRCSRNE